MNDKVTISKQVYESRQYRQVIDTAFTQLTVGAEQEQQLVTTPTVAEFFNNYTQLFYEIPKEGAVQSHRFLVNQSSEYIGGQEVNQDILALQEEITALRQENLQLQEQILNLVKTNG